MGRRNKGGADAIMKIAALLPWWGGIALAIGTFIVLHLVAGIEAVPTANTKDLGGVVVRQFVRTAAGIAQWVVPFLILVGSLISALRKKKAIRLFDDVAHTGSLKTLGQTSWQDFETIVGEYFRRRGFSVAERGGDGPDGGVDLVLTRGSDRYLVQCKQWKAYRVGVELVRELYGVIAARKAAGGFLVTSGAFTDEAARFAAGLEVELIDGKTLAEAMGHQIPAAAATNVAEAQFAASSTTCPTCGAGMVIRTAKVGPKVGQQFWGCSRFPACRGARPIGA
jgi:restriction system protein